MNPPRTRAQAVAAAEAVHEARVVVAEYFGVRVRDGLDDKLYKLEMRYWKLADELGGKKRRKRR